MAGGGRPSAYGLSGRATSGGTLFELLPLTKKSNYIVCVRDSFNYSAPNPQSLGMNRNGLAKGLVSPKKTKLYVYT